MRATLIQEDTKLVESRIKLFEENTGCELLMVITNSADPYPAAALRFGILSGLLISLVFSYYFEFHHSVLWPLCFFLIIFFMSWVGHFAWAKRLALSDWEVQRECDEKAVEFFHTLGTSRVSHNVTAMIMVAVLERQIEIRVDEKLKSKLNQEQLDAMVKVMLTHFREGHMALGLIQSINLLEEQLLKNFEGKVSETRPAELSDTIHFITV